MSFKSIARVEYSPLRFNRHLAANIKNSSNIPSCSTCAMYNYLGYGKDGVCTLRDMPCEGFCHCPKYRRLGGERKLKPAINDFGIKKVIEGKTIRVILYKEPISSEQTVNSMDTEEAQKSTETQKPIVLSEEDILKLKNKLNKGIDITKKTILYAKTKAGKLIKIDGFDMPKNFWGLTKTQVLELAKYGGDYKGITFVNKLLKRGVVCIDQNGNCLLYKSMDNAAKGEHTSEATIRKSIEENKPDVKGRVYIYKWYEEDIPYIERKDCKRSN